MFVKFFFNRNWWNPWLLLSWTVVAWKNIDFVGHFIDFSWPDICLINKLETPGQTIKLKLYFSDVKVWRWMVDSETNLRTVRIKTEKHASFRKNHQITLDPHFNDNSKITKCNWVFLKLLNYFRAKAILLHDLISLWFWISFWPKTPSVPDIFDGYIQE